MAGHRLVLVAGVVTTVGLIAPAVASTVPGTVVTVHRLPPITRRVHTVPTAQAPIVPAAKRPRPLPPRTALVRTLAGMDAGVITRATLGAAPKGFRAGPWLSTRVVCAGASGGRCVLPEWEAQLVAAATAERMDSGQANLGNVIVGFGITATRADGTHLERSGSDLSNARAGERFPGQARTDRELESRIRSTVVADGLTVARLRILHPYGPAPVVVVRAPRVAAANGVVGALEAQLRHLVSRRYDSFEGLYVEVDGPHGRPLAAASISDRVVVGSQWFAPGVDSGIPHG